MKKRAQGSETLDMILNRMLIRNPNFSVQQLADQLGVREFQIYEWCDPNKRRRIPAAMIIPIILATGDTSLIEHLAARVGLVVFHVRKRGKTALENAEDLLANMKHYIDVLSQVVKILKAGKKATEGLDKNSVLKDMEKFMSNFAGLYDDVANMQDQLYLGLEA